MGRLESSGRIDLGMLLAAVVGGGIVALAVLLVFPGRERGAPVGAMAPASADSASLAEAIGKLDQRLARIETGLALQASRGAREELKPSSNPDGSGAHVVGGPEGPDELHNDLIQLSQRVDALTNSLKENRRSGFQLPTLEQMRSARQDVDWNFVEEVRRLCMTSDTAALERVRLMSLDDLLRKVGPPARISDQDGSWWYTRAGTTSEGEETIRGIELYLTRDYVTQVYPHGAD